MRSIRPRSVRGPRRDSPLAAALLVLLAAALFGTLGPVSRSVYEAGMTPFAFVTWRAGLGALAIWAWVRWRRRNAGAPIGLRALPRAEWRALLAAIAAAAVLNLCMFVAFGRTTVAIALLCFYTYPALVAATLAARRVERMDAVRTLSLVFALAGMAAVVLGGMDPAGGIRIDAVGVVLALGAALCQAVFISVSRVGYRSLPADVSMGTVLAGSALVSAAVALAVDGVGTLSVPFADVGLLASLAAVGLFAAALPSFLFLTGIRRLGGVRAGILMLFEPIVGVALAALVLGEAVRPIQLAGGATILVAAAIVQRGHAGVTAPETLARAGPASSGGSAFEPALEPDDGIALHVPGGP